MFAEGSPTHIGFGGKGRRLAAVPNALRMSWGGDTPDWDQQGTRGWSQQHEDGLLGLSSTTTAAYRGMECSVGLGVSE